MGFCLFAIFDFEPVSHKISRFALILDCLRFICKIFVLKKKFIYVFLCKKFCTQQTIRLIFALLSHRKNEVQPGGETASKVDRPLILCYAILKTIKKSAKESYCTGTDADCCSKV